MTLLSPEVSHALGASSVFAAVENRLERRGGVAELQHLRGLSDDELERLVCLERGVTPPSPEVHRWDGLPAKGDPEG